MRIVRRHEPDEERQIEALLIVLRGGALSTSRPLTAGGYDSLQDGEADKEPRATKPRRVASLMRSAAT